MRYISIFVALMFVAAHAVAAEAPDTLNSRTKAATRVIDDMAGVMDLQGRFDEQAARIAKDLEPDERAKVLALVKKHMNVNSWRELQIQSLADSFTTRELNALDAFYSTEEGRSILSKYSTYLLKALPAIDAEVGREADDIRAELDEAGARTSEASQARPTQSQHERLRHLLAAIIVIETNLSNRVQHLEDTYGNVEVTNLYQAIDLSTIDGIHVARQRVADCNAKYDGFVSAQDKRWADLGALVKSNDLDEPQASGLRNSFAGDEAGSFAYYRTWFAAVRADTAAVEHLLDIAERNVGHFKWQEKRLVATDQRTATALSAAQSAIAAADRRFDETGSAALGSPNQTVRFIRAALVQVEQGKLPRD
jgi:hypothetical protein